MKPFHMLHTETASSDSELQTPTYSLRHNLRTRIADEKNLPYDSKEKLIIITSERLQLIAFFILKKIQLKAYIAIYMFIFLIPNFT